MEELNEMCDLSFESQPMQPEKECYSACIVYVEKSLKGMNLEELKKGDKLFNSSESLSDPCLNRPLVIRESLVVGAYAETAVLLLKAIMHAPNNAIRDGWLLPALFSMHQYLELVMKDSIHYFKCNTGGISYSETGYGLIHKLETLWDELKSLLPEPNDEKLDIVSSLLKELDSISDNSMAFRYPFKSDRAGNITAYTHTDDNGDNLLLIDCNTLLERFMQLYGFFEGINALAQESSN